MLFNSFEFLIFFLVFFLIFFKLNSGKLYWQNAFLLFASYVFYGWWDWRFLSLILGSTLLDYWAGLKIKSSKQPKYILLISVFFNLGVLFIFKYFNFFIESFYGAFNVETSTTFSTLNVILPVGISFYTFQTLSYSIDVYRKKIEPTSNFLAFASYVAFFPQLVAGPIERAKHLLPQFFSKKGFSYDRSISGLKLILWGLFKKVVTADTCAEWVNIIFDPSVTFSGSTYLIGAVLFAFQIYGDFSGYSDIAIGTARILGFNLMTNFAFPYFSRDIAEFWRRWHISLSSWFKDYLYIPLGGSKGPLITVLRNVFIIFLVSGLWHGANWTFVIWGALNAMLFVPLLIRGKNRKYSREIIGLKNKISPNEWIGLLFTFIVTCFCWVFFRAETVQQAFGIFGHIFSNSLFKLPEVRPLFVFALIFLFLTMEWIGRKVENPIEIITKNLHPFLRSAIYVLFINMILIFNGRQIEFIYFQF